MMKRALGDGIPRLFEVPLDGAIDAFVFRTSTPNGKKRTVGEVVHNR
jgi:hypothetical protein